MSYTDPSSHRFGGSSSNNVQTYEAAKAQQHTDRQPDKIHWDYNAAFRDEPYRQLHHQNGIIGSFSIRLLEAADLKRSYWSPLALGPVKHLGLSKAHGDVSSYCTFSLGFHDYPRPMYDLSHSIPASNSVDDDDDYQNRKPAAVPTNKDNNATSNSKVIFNGTEWKSSTVVECNNNPVWENCILDLPLRKGTARSDGMRIHLNVRVDEEATAVESFIPGIIAHAGNPNDRLLGIGQLDLTDLVLGESSDGTPVPGVRDEWIPISLTQDDQLQQQDRILIDLQQQLKYDKNDPLAPPATADEPTKNNKSSNDAESITGMVRVLVSYIPNGLDPEKNDIVALETFARRDPVRSSCIPILPPLQPLTVLDRRGPYVFCEYSLPIAFTQRINSGDGNNNKVVKAQVKLHRNAIFVIERQNLLDAAHNLVRLPIDVALSTPLGNAVQNALGPAISAGSELLMPTILSLKLIWMATRATAVASLTGVHALTSTLWREGASSLLHNHNNQPNYNNNNNNNSDRGSQQRRNDTRSVGGTAQFVQL